MQVQFKKNASQNRISTEACKTEPRERAFPLQSGSDGRSPRAGLGAWSSPGRFRAPRGPTMGEREVLMLQAAGDPRESAFPVQQPSKQGTHWARARAEHRPPTADPRPAPGWTPTWVQGEGRRAGRARSEGQQCPAPRKIPATWRIAEPWEQAWPSGVRGHPAHCGPRPGDTHHTEP
jgi:hypothetical protein